MTTSINIRFESLEDGFTQTVVTLHTLTTPTCIDDVADGAATTTTLPSCPDNIHSYLNSTGYSGEAERAASCKCDSYASG